MSGHDGQAVVRVRAPAARKSVAGLVVRWLGAGLSVLVLLLALAAGVLGWGLSRRPLDVTALVRHFTGGRIAGGHLSIDRATLFWDRANRASPLLLRLSGAVLRRDDGSIQARLAEASAGVASAGLLAGRVRPVVLTAIGGSVALVRRADGSIGLDETRPPASTSASTRPRATPFDRLQQVLLRSVDLVVSDRGSNTVWQGRVETLEADGLNGAAGVSGHADLSLRAAGQSTRLTATLTQAPQGAVLSGSATAFDPASLAGIPMLAAGAALDLPIGTQFQLRFDRAWQAQTAALTLQMGTGSIHAGTGLLRVASGSMALTADLVGRRAALRWLHLVLAETANVPAPAVTLRGNAAWSADNARANATLALDLDRISFADLPHDWPEGVARGARDWITSNITAGVARDAHFVFAFSAGPEGLTLTQASGQLAADDLTVWWTRPVPPLIHGAATMTLLSSDALTIAIPAAEQTPSQRGVPPLMISDGSMRITGLSAKDQVSTIDATIGGPVQQAIALLSENRLRLLSDHPLDLGVPSGGSTLRLHVGLPLEKGVTMDQIDIHAAGHMDDLHLGGVIGGHDLDHGNMALDVSQNGLSLKGSAELATIPSNLAVTMDFRAGPPNQTVATYAATGSATTTELEAAGLPAGGLVDGGVGYDASVIEYRDGTGLARVKADLRAATLNVGALGWQKPANADTVADATVRLDHDKVVAVDQLSVVGPDVSVQGRARYQGGQPVALEFDQIVLGQTRAGGELRFATASDPGLHITLHGSMLDLSTRLKPGRDHATPSRAEARAAARLRRAAAAQAAPGRPWQADLRFDRVQLGPDRSLTGVVARAQNDGTLVERADVTGSAGAGSFHMSVAPRAHGRSLHGSAQDAGGLLRAFDLASDIDGGTLQLDASYDDSQPDHPLAGTTLVDRFRIIGAPSVARLLQAMTLYGMVDVLKGPGLGITHLVAPFRFANAVLTLDGARAFSGSLGFTTKGDIDLAAQRADLSGTIIPAYFFNTLLGKIPLVGKLFSPEKGGGVFAATYTLSGPLADPKVGVNPLAALTPGALRGLFGMFQPGTATAPAQATPAAPAAVTKP